MSITLHQAFISKTSQSPTVIQVNKIGITELYLKIKFNGKFSMRILLVEDHTYLGESITRALRSHQWIVNWVKNGDDVMNLVSQASYDAMLLDVGLPGMNGFEILQSLRSKNISLPVLMLTARDTIEDRLFGFQLGADDYLVKPFALRELVARIEAVTRRFHARKDNEIIFGTLRIDLLAKRAFLSDKPLELSPREWSILLYILNNLGKVVSKEQILEAVSNCKEVPSSNTVEVYISRLRTKLSSARIIIRTIRGFGYLIEVPSI